jgi:D-alanyl-D-alanine carboxypeptidase
MGERPPVAPTPRRSPPKGDLYVVWGPGGLSAQAEGRLERVNSTEATTLTTGVMWLEDASSGPVPPAGYGFPVDVAYVEPDEYSRLIGRPSLLRHLTQNSMVVTESSQRTARGTLRARLDGRWYTQRSSISDELGQGYEVLLDGPAPRGWGDRFVIVRSTARLRDLRRVARKLSERPVAVVVQDHTLYLRYAHSVAPPSLFKEHLGEFAARPASDGTLVMHPRWVEKNIVYARLPVLGRVRCHRDVVYQLQLALREIAARKADAVEPDQYAGCYSPRFIGHDPAGRISAHAWGAAIDLNAADNPLGSRPTMDTSVVYEFDRIGFTWGGDWLIPDGMHFEWYRPLGS